MAFNFKVFERTERTELGTIASIVGAKGTVAPIPSNLKDATKRVVLVLTNAKGQSDTCILSSKLSRLFRSKEVSLSQLVKMIVVEQPNAAGELMNLVVMPSREGSTLQHIAIASLDKNASFESESVEQVSLEELIAL